MCSVKTAGSGVDPDFNVRVQWKDENFDPLAARIPRNNNLPTAEGISGTDLAMAGFPTTGGITEVPISGIELNHDWKPGTSIWPHVHYATLGSAQGVAKWFFEYRIWYPGMTPIDGTISATQAVDSTNILVKEIGEIDLSSIDDVGAQITFRLYRNPNDAEDTHNSTLVVATFGWHYEVNSDGSRGRFTK